MFSQKSTVFESASKTNYVCNIVETPRPKRFNGRVPAAQKLFWLSNVGQSPKKEEAQMAVPMSGRGVYYSTGEVHKRPATPSGVSPILSRPPVFNTIPHEFADPFSNPDLLPPLVWQGPTPQKPLWDRRQSAYHGYKFEDLEKELSFNEEKDIYAATINYEEDRPTTAGTNAFSLRPGTAGTVSVIGRPGTAGGLSAANTSRPGTAATLSRPTSKNGPRPGSRAFLAQQSKISEGKSLDEDTDDPYHIEDFKEKEKKVGPNYQGACDVFTDALKIKSAITLLDRIGNAKFSLFVDELIALDRRWRIERDDLEPGDENPDEVRYRFMPKSDPAPSVTRELKPLMLTWLEKVNYHVHYNGDKIVSFRTQSYNLFFSKRHFFAFDIPIQIF